MPVIKKTSILLMLALAGCGTTKPVARPLPPAPQSLIEPVPQGDMLSEMECMIYGYWISPDGVKHYDCETITPANGGQG